MVRACVRMSQIILGASVLKMCIVCINERVHVFASACVHDARCTERTCTNYPGLDLCRANSFVGIDTAKLGDGIYKGESCSYGLAASSPAGIRVPAIDTAFFNVDFYKCDISMGHISTFILLIWGHTFSYNALSFSA